MPYAVAEGARIYYEELGQGSPILFVHKDCGHQFQPQVSCSACGGAVNADAVQAIPGPGGAAKRGTRIVARRLRAAAL